MLTHFDRFNFLFLTKKFVIKDLILIYNVKTKFYWLILSPLF